MAHARIKGMYDWANVAARTEIVYKTVMESETLSLWDRIARQVLSSTLQVKFTKRTSRSMALGRFAGPIFTIILVMQCLFFTALEWAVPLSEIDMVENEWDDVLFFKVVIPFTILIWG